MKPKHTKLNREIFGDGQAVGKNTEGRTEDGKD